MEMLPSDPPADRPAPAPPARAARTPRVGVLVVAYNARTTISQVLSRIPPATWERISEVFVFDDSSRDDTARIAGEERARFPRLSVFRNQVNLGYGGNQKRGYRYAMERGLDVVVLLHGDGQYAPEIMDRLIDPILAGEAEAVFGSRMLEPGAARRGGMPLYKYVGNRILTTGQNLLMGERLSEYHSGYRAYSVAALRKLPFFRNSNDFHFDNEIIVQLMAAGMRIREVPIPTYYGDEICYVNGMAYAGNVARTVLRYRLHRAGLLYARQFDLRGGQKYAFKRSGYSSHGRIIEAVRRLADGRSLDVLDVGCGAGFLARHIAAMGHRVCGVDVYDSPEAREHCTRFVVADVERTFGAAPGERFDCIVLADVIEHTRNPEQVLLRARRLLRPGGRVVVSTGNVAHLYVRLSLLLGRFDYTERGILDRTHVRLFTRDSLRELLIGCGFGIVGEQVTPIPFEAVVTGWPELTERLARLNHLIARAWPGAFAYQTVLEVAPEDRATELLREEEIHEGYSEV